MLHRQCRDDPIRAALPVVRGESLAKSAATRSVSPIKLGMWAEANARREAAAEAWRGQHNKAPAQVAQQEQLARIIDASVCHYCPKPATTRDHIVPCSRLARKGQRFAVANIVPACLACNQEKADARSDCGCATCVTAWLRFGPDDWATTVPVVSVIKRAG